MFQEAIIVLIFLSALGYIFYIVRKSFSSKESSCPKGCGCSGIDIEKIEQEIKAGKIH